MFKEQFGWKARAFTVEFGGGEKKPLLVLTRRVARMVTFAYVPWGPELPGNVCPAQTEAVTKILSHITDGLRPHLPRAALIRFDLPWHSEGAAPPHPAVPFTKAPVSVQAPDTVYVGLGPDEDAILARMKPKWRYNIRLGGKKVTVIRCGPERLPDFYALLEETARRDRIFIHSPAYYRALFGLAEKNASPPALTVSLYLAEYEGARGRYRYPLPGKGSRVSLRRVIERTPQSHGALRAPMAGDAGRESGRLRILRSLRHPAFRRPFPSDGGPLSFQDRFWRHNHPSARLL
jgi:hypothetical protein